MEELVRLNKCDQIGRTPLHLAVQNGQVAVARTLVEAGAEIAAKDNARRTAEDLAKRTQTWQLKFFMHQAQLPEASFETQEQGLVD